MSLSIIVSTYNSPQFLLRSLYSLAYQTYRDFEVLVADDGSREDTADAIRLSQEGTQVRLVIIWSLNAAYFGGGSPEAGYAIIRPDGTCPACDLIEPLLKEPGS